MILSYNFDVPGFDVTKHIFVGYVDEVTKEHFTTYGFLESQAALYRLRDMGYDAKFSLIGAKNTPVIVLGESVETMDFSGAVNIMQDALNTKTKEEINELRQYLVEFIKSLNFDDEIASIMSNMLSIHCMYEKETQLDNAEEPITIDIALIDPEFRPRIVKALEELTGRLLNPITCIESHQNDTKFQNNPEDDLFIRIPNPNAIRGGNVSECIDSMNRICVPYKYEAARTPFYEESGIPADLFPTIRGNKENNTFELYDNEKLYYKALTEWTEYNMRKEFGSADGKVIDLLSQNYFFELIARVYMWHWAHNPSVPDEIDDKINAVSEDSENSASTDAAFASRFIYYKHNPSNYNAVIILFEFLKEASSKLGYRVFLDCLIQLLRWGNRKPTRIVFKDYNKEFDLGNGLIRNQIGNIEDYKIDSVNGKDSQVIGLLYDDSNICDASIGCRTWEFPVGVVLQTKYVNGDSKLEILQCIHFTDLRDALTVGGVTIDGIDLHDDEWVVEQLNELGRYTVSKFIRYYQDNKENILKFPFYRSDKLKEFFVNLRANNSAMPSNVFSIMHTRVADPNLQANASKAVFSNNAEMYELIKMGVAKSIVAIAELAIVREFLPVYKDMVGVNTNNLKEIIEAWESASAQQVKETPKQEVTQQQQQPQQQSVPQEQIGIPDVETVAFSWIKVIPANAKVSPIVDATGATICYYYTDVVKSAVSKKLRSRYTITSSLEGRVLDESSKILIDQLLPLMLYNVYVSTKCANGVLYFENADTIRFLCEQIKQGNK